MLRNVLLSLCLVILWSACSKVQENYGYFWSHSGSVTQAVLLEENPFLLPSVRRDATAFLVKMPEFHPEFFELSFQSLGGETQQSYELQFESIEGRHLFRAMLPLKPEGFGVFRWVNGKGDGLPRGVFWGDHHQAIRWVHEESDYANVKKLQFIKQYRQVYPERMIDEYAAVAHALEKEQLLALVNTDGTNRPPSDERALESFQRAHGFGFLQQHYANERARINLAQEDHDFAEYIYSDVSNLRLRNLRSLERTGAGVNAIQVVWQTSLALKELEAEVLDRIQGLNPWNRKLALHRFLQNPLFKNLKPQAETSLAALNHELDSDFFENVISIRNKDKRKQGLTEYLTWFPEGAHRLDAQERIDTINFELEKDTFDEAMEATMASREKGLTRFLELYPGSRFEREANEALAEVRVAIELDVFETAAESPETAEKIEALNYYLEIYPMGLKAREARTLLKESYQDLEYQTFAMIKSLQGTQEKRLILEQYLQIYPNGLYKEEVQETLDKLKEK